MLSIVFGLEACIDITDEVVADVVADVHLDKVAEFPELDKHVLVEVVELCLEFGVGEGTVRVQVTWVLVHVREEDRA